MDTTTADTMRNLIQWIDGEVYKDQTPPVLPLTAHNAAAYLSVLVECADIMREALGEADDE